MVAQGEAAVTQVADDPGLLDLMMQDLKAAAPIYQPTNYWANYERRFVPELRQRGLRDFRRRRRSVLGSFGATDLLPEHTVDFSANRGLNNQALKRIPLWARGLRILSRIATKACPIIAPYEPEDMAQLCYWFARLSGQQAGAKDLADVEDTLIGNPEHVLWADGKPYTLSFLNAYLNYVYCHRFMNMEQVRLVMELGSGSGRQVEVLRRLHPDIGFYLFDLPPQLYVCEQYLKAVFPDSVVSYRETREMQRLPLQAPGKIMMFGNWRFPLLGQVEIDLFWNAGSFQEMEPAVVANYLGYVNRAARRVFLLECMEGKEVAGRAGAHGVLEPTTIQHYTAGLPSMRLRDLSLCPLLPRPRSKRQYSLSFWERVDAAIAVGGGRG